MSLPWKRHLKQRRELVCNLLQKMELTRGYLPEKSPHDPKLGMLPGSRTILRHDRNFRMSKKDMFQLLLNVPQFIPEEIEVKLVGNVIIVHGKHDEHLEEHSWVSREFTRRFKIPADIESSTVKPVVSNGVLVITASKKDTEPVADDEWIVPVEIVAS